MEIFFTIRYIISIFCLLSNLLVCIAVSKTQLLRESPTFRILSVIFITNIIDLGKQCVYNYPSDIMGKPILKAPYDIIFHMIGGATWFAELYLLICMALSHYIALYHAPFYFKIQLKQLNYFIIIILLMAYIIGCLHLIVPNSGFDYDSIKGQWIQNANALFMRIRFYNNYGAQIIALMALIITDIAILMKFWARTTKYPISSVNSNYNSNQIVTSTSKSSQARLGKVSNMRVAANFVILSSCLVIQTIIYNTITYNSNNSFILNVLMTIAPLFRYSKCWIYCISGSHLRKAIKNILPKKMCF